MIGAADQQADLATHLEARHVRKAKVQHDQPRRLRRRQVDSRSARRRFDDSYAGPAARSVDTRLDRRIGAEQAPRHQRVADGTPDLQLIVDHEHGHRRHDSNLSPDQPAQPFFHELFMLAVVIPSHQARNDMVANPMPCRAAYDPYSHSRTPPCLPSPLAQSVSLSFYVPRSARSPRTHPQSDATAPEPGR